MKLLFAFLLSLLLAGHVLAAGEKNELRCALYTAYLNDDMPQWTALIHRMELLPDSSAAWEQEILLAHYGLAGYYLGNKLKKEAKAEVEIALAKLEKIQERYPDEASFFCMDACFSSLQMGISRIQAPVLYTGHQANLKRAEEINPEDVLLSFERANMLFHLPGLLGGDKDEAIVLYKETLARIERQPEFKCDWFHLMVQLFLLKAFRVTKEEPNYQELLQQIEQEHGKLDWLQRFLDSDVTS